MISIIDDFTFTKQELKNIRGRITRKNNKIKAKYPLMFDVLKTSFEEEAEQEVKNILHKTEYQEHLRLVQIKFWQKCELYKRFLTAIGRRDIIFRTYRSCLKYNLSVEYYCDKMCTQIAEAFDITPLEVQSFIKMTETMEIL